MRAPLLDGMEWMPAVQYRREREGEKEGEREGERVKGGATLLRTFGSKRSTCIKQSIDEGATS